MLYLQNILLQVTQVSMIEKDYEEVFSSQGEVTVLVPEVKGELTVYHSGNYASNQSYYLKVRYFFLQWIEHTVSGFCCARGDG